ncbi:hypothetical protein MJO28_001797 [Puccinia striiformis f. sp. tritici]|uniref:Uncharacterized protein n=1 Tax=Puccinia striiformis f. sp. tritici TaxID=168172 RepID=A0ACC0EWU4_9BASI|nr:hypothetical protein MJO28_001797 [Puccinia striiformis f. sp. tritici]
MNGRIMVGESGKPGKGNKCGVMVLKLTWIKASGERESTRFEISSLSTTETLRLTTTQYIFTHPTTSYYTTITTVHHSARFSSIQADIEPRTLNQATVDHPISQPFGILQAAPCAITQPSPALLNA